MTIHFDEVPTSPVVTHGENPQAEYTLRVFSDNPKQDRFDDQTAYSVASAWFMRNSPKHDTGLFLRTVTVTPLGAVNDLFECVGVWSKWSGDLPEYIMERDVVRIALRTAKDADATDQEWIDFTERLKKRMIPNEKSKEG